MLKEIEKVRQIEGEPRRRWFSDTELDLYIWYDDDDIIIQFQICYDKGEDEHALTWHREHGLAHHGIDDGETSGLRMKSTPILVTDDEFNIEKAVRKFTGHAGDMDYKTVSFILDRLGGNNQ